ncbi:MAG: hypothetical protein ACRDTE_04590, partial [Pseudonocardiaceae bacterium]
EKGQRGFNRRGLIEDLAGALGCSVTDLTGEPYQPVDRDTADALAAVPGVQVALPTTAQTTCRTCGPGRWTSWWPRHRPRTSTATRAGCPWPDGTSAR